MNADEEKKRASGPGQAFSDHEYANLLAILKLPEESEWKLGEVDSPESNWPADYAALQSSRSGGVRQCPK
jgi:hypothetical protein